MLCVAPVRHSPVVLSGIESVVLPFVGSFQLIPQRIHRRLQFLLAMLRVCR